MSFETETKTADKLIAGGFPIVEVPVTIASGSGVLQRGTVLGKITATGKYKAYNNSANDGSETARLILAEKVDATSADVNTIAYRTGEFNESALTGIDNAAKVDFETTPIIIIKKIS